MLELKHISKRFSESIILDDISIKFAKSGLIGILGESGGGKSTLLSIVGLLDQDYDGEIFYDGEHIQNDKAFIREHISYMMQNKDYIPALTVQENIVLSCRVSHVRYSQQKLKRITSQLGIEDVLSCYPSQLSGGQLKRVSIAKALLKDADIILCDEPTGALHSQQAHEVMAHLKTISQNALVIVVSHDATLLKLYCQHVLTLKKGKLNRKRLKATPDIKHPQFQHHYSLWNYSLRQFLFQRNKLIFLFVFQWIVIVTFFLIVTAFQGVFEAIQVSEQSAVTLNVLSVENKKGEIFTQFFKNAGIYDMQYSYDLDQLQVTSSYQNVKSMIHFLPQQQDHILLKKGRLPQRANEVVVSHSLFLSLLDKEKLHFNYEDIFLNMKVVGVLQDSFFNQKEIYLSPLLKEDLSLLKNQYTLIIETVENQNQSVYQQLSQSFVVYSEVLERVNNYQSLLQLAQMIAMVFIGMSLIISILLVTIVESIIYTERQHDIAYLLSLGLEKKRLFTISLGEALFVGVVMAIGGCLFSFITYTYLNDVYQIADYVHFQLLLKPIFWGWGDLYIVVVLVYCFISMFGILLPTRKMMSLNMIETLREE